MNSKPQKRTQEERSATTREALLTAAITELHAHGYGATSTVAIAKRAGVSRGAMVHQFPTKADLMVFVVEEVARNDVAEYARILEDVDDPRERMLAYPEAAWRTMSRPSGVAVLEIIQGSRSDAVLADKLRPIQARIGAEALRKLEEEMGRPPSLPLVHLIIWAMRGLSIANVLSGNDEEARQSIDMLRAMTIASLDAGVLEPPREKHQPAQQGS